MGGQESPTSSQADPAALERDLHLLSRRGGPGHPGVFDQATALKHAMVEVELPPALDQFLQVLDRAILRLDDQEQQVVTRAAFRRRPYNQPLLVDRLNTILCNSGCCATCTQLQDNGPLQDGCYPAACAATTQRA